MKKTKMKLLSFIIIFSLALQVVNLTSIAAIATPYLDTNTYLIGLKNGTDLDKFIQTKGFQSKNLKKAKSINVLAIELNQNEIQNLQNDNDIAFLELDSTVEIASTGKVEKDHPSVTNMQQLQNVPWGIEDIGVLPALENKIDGNKIKIAVLDTGISNHDDLKIAGGTSFVEGITDYQDDNGHGTHVAGTIAASNNGFGVLGAASKADIYSVKVLDKNGSGSYGQVIQGIDWAIQNKINIVSMSFGGTVNSQALNEAIKEANNNGILVIAAAGNAGAGEDTMLYPAKCPEVISVGAVDRDHTKASFSSTGPELDLVAPGVEILSTTLDGGYGVLSGTSMAAPHVTGAAAALWSQNTNLSSENVKQKLYETATPLGRTNEYGHGLVDLDRALGIDNSPIIPPEVETPPTEQPQPSGDFNIIDQDNKLLDLSNKLLDLIQQAKGIGDTPLAKNIENQYNELLIINTELHKLPSDFKEFSKEDVSSKNLAENNYYATQAESFRKLENQYNQLISQFENQIASSMLNKNDVENSQAITGQNEVTTTSYEFVGDGQTIAPGGSARVSLKLFEPKSAVYIKVFNVNTPSTIIASTTYYNQPANTPISYTWYTSTTTPEGTYRIQFTYPNISTVEYFTIYVKKSTSIYTLYANSPVDVSLSSGAYRIYKFTPSTTGMYKIFTGPYGGYGSENDTYLELYNDPNLTSLRKSNDDANGTVFSEIKEELTAGVTYYLKLRHYSSTGSVYTRLTATLEYPISQINYNIPIDVDIPAGGNKIYKFTPPSSGNYKIYTTYYGGTSSSGSSDTLLYLFSDANLSSQIGYNDDTVGTFSEIKYTLTGGSNYYIKLAGYGGGSVHARIMVTVVPPIAFTTLVNKTPVDVSKPAGESAYFKFTPLTTGLYRFFTEPYQGTGAENDTYLHLYSDANLTNQLASNDDVSGGPYGSLFSKIEYNLTAGTTYYIKLRHYSSSSVLSARFTVEDDFDSTRSVAQIGQWDQLHDYNLSSRYDIDYYLFTLDEPQDLRFIVDNNQVTLENTNGNLLANYLAGDETTIYTASTAGTYYAKVSYNASTQGMDSTNVTIQASGKVTGKKVKLIGNQILQATPGAKKPVTIRWWYQYSHPTTIVVYKNGVVVYDKFLGTYPAGYNTVSWDGTTTSGNQYAAGYASVPFVKDDAQGYQVRIVPEEDGLRKYFSWANVPVKNIDPVVFVPGVTGTLFRSPTEQVWTPDVSSDTAEWGDLSQLQLATNGYNPLDPSYNISYQKGRAGIMAEYFGFDAYLPLMQRLEAAFRENLTLFYAPYDWRKNLEDRSGGRLGQYRELKRVIDNAKNIAGTSKVNIISHSLGSLLTKTYLISDLYSNDVNRWVAAGPPFAGSAKAYLALEYGYDFGIMPVDERNIKRLAPNMPAVYNLLPYSGLVNSNSNYRFVGEVDIDLDGDGVYTPTWDYTKSKNYLRSKYNALLFDEQETWKTNLNTTSIPASVEQIVVVGSGNATPNRFDAESHLIGDDYTTVQIVNGDETVPVDSAKWYLSPTAKIWYAQTTHLGLVQNEFAGLLVDLVQDGKALPTSTYRQLDGPFALNGIAIYTNNDVKLEAISSTNDVIDPYKIKGSSYQQLGNIQLLFLPDEIARNYKIRLKGITLDTEIVLEEIYNDETSSIKGFKNLTIDPSQTEELIAEIDINQRDEVVIKNNNGEVKGKVKHKILR